MKTLYTFVNILFMALIGFSACTDDTELQEIHPGNQDDGFVTLKLGYESQNDKEIIVSRSAATAPEKQLYDLHFYVFDANGNLTGYEEILPVDKNDVIEEAQATEKVSIRAKSGVSYIYAVANINASTTYYLSDADLNLLNIDKGTTDEEYRTNIENSSLTRAKFLAIQFNRVYGDENRLYSPDPSGDVFVMSGYINDGNTVTIPKGTNGTTTLPNGQNIIKLYRILSKTTFTVSSGTTKGTFTPKYYRLCNVPTAGTLVPKAGISMVNTYLNNNVTNVGVESSYRWNFEGNEEISFYLPENLQTAKNNTISQWKDREKNVWNGSTKTFTNAADKATYLEIHGDFADKKGSVTANVCYTVHFGDFSSATKLNDFNVIRNHSYKYKVTIDGVDDIKVEAQTTTGEDNPYAEGLIVDATGGKHYDVDAHYEARVMTFKKSTIADLRSNNSGYILSIQTPFGETKETVNVKSDGVYSMSGNKLCDINDVASLFHNEADYQWMKFVKNTTDNRVIANADISKHTCKYPGDQGKPANPVLNVFQLLAALYDDAVYTENNNTEVYYTCFIDEYYYANKSWPEYVDKDPRSMLIANDLDVSADKKSLYAKVAYSISQRSISTFYTTDYIYPGGDNNTDLVKAFGTEIIDEEDVYESRFSNYNNNNDYGTISNPHDWNARTSAKNTHLNGGWYDGVKPVEGIQPLYTKVAKACMSRNRDLNGNGTIDDNEIRWYLAGVGQYRALFYGRNSLDQDSYLITEGDLKDIDDALNNTTGHEYRGRYHYFTSSSGNKVVFWPEEGLSTGVLGDGYSYAEMVRCVRTLEANGPGLQDPEEFYTYDSESRTFNMGGIKVTRQATSRPLAYHNEIQPLNNLYSSFVIASKDLTGINLGQVTGKAQGNYQDPCLNYSESNNDRGTWRSPNQKELALMLSSVANMESKDYATRTQFTGTSTYNWYPNSQGFWSKEGRVTVQTGGSNLNLRCVRDI